jgi:taurine dioxygenase
MGRYVVGYGTMRIDPLGPLGATVSGVNLGQPLPHQVLEELRAAWLDHHVLYFPQQHLTPDQQAAFASTFGELDVYPFMNPLPDCPHVIPLIKEADAQTNFGGGWHTDTSYTAEPPMATVLCAVEVPTEGGDTLFADATAAYSDLSIGMRRLLDGLSGIYSPKIVHGKNGAYAKLSAGSNDLGDAYGGDQNFAESEVEHPLIRTHPETGQKSIFCSPPHTHRIVDMTREESLPLLNFLMNHLTQDKYVSRIHWSSGAVAIWDNRCVFHYALNDYAGKRRHMNRVIIKGDAPV